MRALGKAPGAGIFGALFAVPSMLGPSMPPTYPPTQYPVTPPSPPTIPSVERLRELKQMLDEGLITAEEYEKVKKDILEQMKKTSS